MSRWGVRPVLHSWQHPGPGMSTWLLMVTDPCCFKAKALDVPHPWKHRSGPCHGSWCHHLLHQATPHYPEVYSSVFIVPTPFVFFFSSIFPPFTCSQAHFFFSGDVRLLIIQMFMNTVMLWTGQNTELRHGLSPLCNAFRGRAYLFFNNAVGNLKRHREGKKVVSCGDSHLWSPQEPRLAFAGIPLDS